MKEHKKMMLNPQDINALISKNSFKFDGKDI